VTTQALLDVPCIDGLTDDDLAALDRVLTALAVITDAMIRARARRRSGDVEAALSWERFVDARHRQLPEWARW
jgi:hypothetical protein